MSVIQLGGYVPGAPPSPVIIPRWKSLLDGLIAWYRANGTNRAATGSPFNLAAVGSPTTGPGITGAAATAMVTTLTDYYEGFPSVLNNSPLSMSGWISRAWGDSGDGPIILGNADDGQPLLAADAADDPMHAIPRGRTAGSAGGQVTSTVVTGGVPWVHAALTYDRTKLDLWCQAILVARLYDPGDLPASWNSITLGQPNMTTCSNQDIGIWSRALTDAEIAYLYGEGYGFDPTV